MNKSTKEISYEKSLIGKGIHIVEKIFHSKLITFSFTLVSFMRSTDPVKEFEEQITECQRGLSEVSNTLPIRINRNDNFLEIWVEREKKYDIFETSVSGSICKQELQTERNPNVSVPRAPADCFS